MKKIHKALQQIIHIYRYLQSTLNHIICALYFSVLFVDDEKYVRVNIELNELRKINGKMKKAKSIFQKRYNDTHIFCVYFSFALRL